MASPSTAYDPEVLSAMTEVERKFHEMVCATHGIDDVGDLPKNVRGVNVFQFAELTPAAISSLVSGVLEGHLPPSKQSEIGPIVDEALAAIESARAKNPAVWPDAASTLPNSHNTHKSTNFDASVEERRGGAAQKFMTAKYDFKMMRRLTTIENKFLGALCGFYGVEDEEELPASVQEISFGEMFEAKLSADQMRQIMVRRT